MDEGRVASVIRMSRYNLRSSFALALSEPRGPRRLPFVFVGALQSPGSLPKCHRGPFLSEGEGGEIGGQRGRRATSES